MVLLLPAAVYALSAGYAPFLQCYKGLPLWYPFVDVNETTNDWDKVLFCPGIIDLWISHTLVSLMKLKLDCEFGNVEGRTRALLSASTIWMLCGCTCKNWYGFHCWGIGILFS